MSQRGRIGIVAIASVGITAALSIVAEAISPTETARLAAITLAALASSLLAWLASRPAAPSVPADPDPAQDRTPTEHTPTERAPTERDAQIAMEVIETSSFGIAMVDAGGIIIGANPAFRGMFRLRGEPEGRRPIEVVPVVEIHEVIEEALSGSVSAKAVVTASRDLEARAQPLSGGRAIVTIEDVTGQREAERARTDFVANVSHELRTPLTAIMGYLELLTDASDRIDDDLVELLQTVDRNAHRLRDLFEDLLRLHRIEARRRELPVERALLMPILSDAVGPARDRAKMRDQSLQLSCPADLEGVVNPEALSAIVGNLAANASSYTPPGGRIVVRGYAAAGEVRVEVADDGIGIAERHHERIFERFYRVDEARSQSVGGTGLGLAIVKHYALASGCNVTLRSREGEGSTFTVHLPGA